MRGWRLVVFAGLVLALLWGMRSSSPRPQPEIVESRPTIETLGEQFNASQCGTIDWRVRWEGSIPSVPPLNVSKPKYKPPVGRGNDNPNAPRVSPRGELANVAVMVRGIDPLKSRPWNYDPTTVEIVNHELRVHPAVGAGPFGIVRRGATVDLISREPRDHSIRGRGANFFNQMLFSMDQAVSRRLPNEGIVELDSGTWYYWLRAYLIVSDHPYVGVSGVDGKVQLEQVPAGEYEIVCWKANWHIAQIERDREWMSQNGIVYAPAVEKKNTIRVAAGEKTSVEFRFQSSDFAPLNSNK